MPLFWFGKPGKSVDLEDYQYTFQNQHIQLKQDLEESSIFDKNIQNIKNYLYAGDVYQINYTQPIIFDFKVTCFCICSGQEKHDLFNSQHLLFFILQCLHSHYFSYGHDSSNIDLRFQPYDVCHIISFLNWN